MKDSVIFYRSFYEIIKELPDKSQIELYNAIFKKYFYGEETELKGISKGVFGLIVPNIDSANKRYFSNIENGKKGGRPKKQNKTQEKPNNNPTITQEKPNNNLNENDNDNVNVNDNDNNNIYSVIEQNFGRTLSTMEIQKIDEWLLLYKRDIIEYAVSIAIMNNKKTFNYINGIIKNWKSCNYETIQEIKDNEIKQHKNEKDVPEWFNQDLNKKKEMDEDEKRIYRKITGSDIE